MRHIEWPTPPQTFEITVYGDGEKIAQELKTLSETKSIDGKKVTVQSEKFPRPKTSTQLAFISGKDKASISKTIQALEGCHCLIVTNTSKEFLQGAAINIFTAEGDHLAFQASPEAAAKEQIQIGAQILRHAKEAK